MIIQVKFVSMNISLSEGLEIYIKNKVATGDYNSASEVVNEALLLLKEQDEKKQVLRSALQEGFDDIEAGRISTQSIDEIFEETVAQRNKVKSS